MLIDADVHFWKYSKDIEHPFVRKNKILQTDYLPAKLFPSLERNGIGGCIAVASEPAEVETRFLAELARTHPGILGIVGWVDLHETNALQKLTEFKSYAQIRGYRMPSGKKNSLSPEVMDFMQEHAYVIDLSLGESEASGFEDWIGAYPDQSFVLENCGNPDTRERPSAGWETQIRSLAKNPNLYCKVAGMLTRGNWKSWKPADFYPFLDILFDSFGPGRLLYASDWPFMLLAGIYVQWKSLLEKFTEHLVEEDRDLFFGGNARRIYRL